MQTKVPRGKKTVKPFEALQPHPQHQTLTVEQVKYLQSNRLNANCPASYIIRHHNITNFIAAYSAMVQQPALPNWIILTGPTLSES